MRNTGRPKPTATQFPGAGSFISRHSGSLAAPNPAVPEPRNDAYRADYKPDFLPTTSSEQRGVTPQAKANPGRPRSISEQYDLARQQLTNPAPVEGFATEKQRRDYAWEVRDNPLGARDKAQDFQRIYQRGPSPQSAPPVRPTNFNGPRQRFS